jgi:pimeloyl-ACP methyl ester carboxylesterase
MKHPLESYVYFLHGYFGDNSDFSYMKAYLEESLYLRYHSDCIKYYSYFEDYPGIPENLVHYVPGGVSTFSENFYNRLISDHSEGTQIDIVAHSLGGMITREMLRLHRTDLETEGIEIGRVITLGTPHYGTQMACANLGAIGITVLLSLFGDMWLSPVFLQMHPSSCFITDLNSDPESYMSGIEWYSIGGYDALVGNLLYIYGILDGPNDLLVTMNSALVPFASDSAYINGSHGMLVKDGAAGDSYPIVDNWLSGGIDTDGDGIIDVEERYIYFTDPFDGDTDNDNLNDFDEIFIHGTNPNAWSTDADILSDSQEIAWGYDPDNTYDPINAQELTYSAWQVKGMTGCVRANHYTAMDYVKIYVKYMDSLGCWTSFFFIGTDTSPDYYGDYYMTWSLLQGYVHMRVKVEAYDSYGHYLGCDNQYVELPGGGGGGGGGYPSPD